MVAVGLVGFLSKLIKWDESAMYFDGSSLGALFEALPFHLPLDLFAFSRVHFRYRCIHQCHR